MWKRRGFFDQRNCIEKVRGMTWKIVETWSLMNRRNIHVESTSIRCGVPVELLHKYKVRLMTHKIYTQMLPSHS